MSRRVGLGLKLPVRPGAVGYFDTAWDAITQTKSNLTNLVLTKKGERIMQPKFGCDIHKLVFDQITDDVKANANGYIVEAAAIWLPYVIINDVQLRKDEDRNKVMLAITFSLKSTANITDLITLVI